MTYFVDRPVFVLFSQARPILMIFFVVVKKSTWGDIGYVKLSHFILIQNCGGSKLCLLCCFVGHVRECVARPCVCMCVVEVCGMGVVCMWWDGCGVWWDVCDGCGVCVMVVVCVVVPYKGQVNH
jgi:hypothetical protein